MADEREGEKDVLSFFAVGDDDSSSSDSEGEEEISQKLENKSTSKGQNDTKNVSPSSKLPSPDTLFATIGKPKFLNTLQEETLVDWNKLSTQYNPAVITAAPMVSLEEREKDERYSDATIASTPMKYGKELTDIQKHIVLHGKRGSDIRLMTHTESSVKDDGKNEAVDRYNKYMTISYT